MVAELGPGKENARVSNGETSIWCYTSSQSVANFCPRKKAQLNQEGFDAKVKAKVKQGRRQTSEQDEANFEC